MECGTWRAGPLVPSVRVRLAHDLTEYHPGLRAGVEGVTTGDGRYGVLVRFPEAGVQDILSKSLDIVDEEFIRERAEKTRERNEALKTATDVEVHLGPRGGFRRLSYDYVENGISTHRSVYSRDETDDIRTVLEEHGVPVREVRER